MAVKSKVNNFLKIFKQELYSLKNPQKAELLKRFFKTGKNTYGEKDLFLGITVPKQREVAKKYCGALKLLDLAKTIKSKFHEERATVLHILIMKYRKGNKKDKKSVYNFYIKHIKFINNWDLVDLSCHHIIGDYLFEFENKNISKLVELAKENNLWKKRIAIVSTFYFIKQKDATAVLTIARILINDMNDLIQKSVGWMLREMGKRINSFYLVAFLDENYKTMPRTMLRYSIERLENNEKIKYIKKEKN